MDGTASSDFKDYLDHLRRMRWQSQSDITSDPLVIKICRGTGIKNPLSFVRLLNRVRDVGSASPKNLHRLSLAFGFGTTVELVEDFDRWRRRTRSRNAQAGSSDGLYRHHIDGYFYLPPGTELTSRDGEKFVVRQRLSPTGSRGDSYIAIRSGTKERVFIKTLTIKGTPNNPLVIQQIDNRIRQFEMFFFREHQMLLRLADVRGVAKFLGFGHADLLFDKGSPRRVPFLVQQHVDGQNLAQYAHRHYSRGKGKFAGIPDPREWMRIVRELLGIVYNVHGLGIRHGDLQLSNVMVMRKTGEIILVDFGQSGIPLPTDRPHGDVSRDVAPAPERVRTPKMPLEPAEDIFGLGRIMLWLATGVDLPKEGVGDDYATKEFVMRTLQSRNPNLCEANPGVAYAISQALHDNPRERASQVEDLTQTLDVFATIGGVPDLKPAHVPDLSSEIASLTDAISDLTDRSLFSLMIRNEISQLVRRTREMLAYDRLEVSGTRDRFISTMLSLLATLEPGDLYVTTSSPTFWSKANLGVKGRFWEANRLLAERGIRIRRLIVTSKRDAVEVTSDREYSRIFQSQVDLIDSLKDRVDTLDKDIPGQGFYTGVCSCDDDKELEAIISSGYHIGIVQKRDFSLSLSFQLDERQIVRKMFIWKLTAGTFLVERMTDIAARLARSVPVRDWVQNQLPLKLQEWPRKKP